MPIMQEVKFDCQPDAIYAVLVDGDRFSEMTDGAPAEISADIGGAATLFGGHIEARNIELVPGKRVVQTWRSTDWPEGVHSVVCFELSQDGAGTQLSFRQAGYPDDAEGHLDKGWHDMYWQPMKALLAQP